MASFGALAAAFDGPGLRCTGAVLAARTHQTLHAGLMHIRSELDVGVQHDYHSFLLHHYHYHMLPCRGIDLLFLLLTRLRNCASRGVIRKVCVRS